MIKDLNLDEELKISAKLAGIIYDALDDKQGLDIKILDIHEVSVLADYFIIAHGNNPNHVRALLDNVEEKVNENGFNVNHTEGYNEGSWALMDCERVIVHVFHKEARVFYDLERIWAHSREMTKEALDDISR